MISRLRHFGSFVATLSLDAGARCVRRVPGRDNEPRMLMRAAFPAGPPVVRAEASPRSHWAGGRAVCPCLWDTHVWSEDGMRRWALCVLGTRARV